MPADPMCFSPPKETMACCWRDVTRECNPMGATASSVGVGGLRYRVVDKDPALSASWAPGGLG